MKIIIHTDGGSRGNPGKAAIGVHIASEEKLLFEVAEYIGIKTNNGAEYSAVVRGLEYLVQQKQTLTPSTIEWFSDSKLVVEQLSKRWKIKDARMRQFAQTSWQLMEQVGGTHTFTYIPREQNKRADALVNQALDSLSAVS